MSTTFTVLAGWQPGAVLSVLVSIKEGALHGARVLHGWLTEVCGQINHSPLCNQPPKSTTEPSIIPDKINRG